jgi:hypothetical protein
VLQVLATQIEQIEAAVTVLEKQLMAWHKSNPCQPALGDNSWHRSHYRYRYSGDGGGAERLSQRSRICSVARSGTATEFHRRQKPLQRSSYFLLVARASSFRAEQGASSQQRLSWSRFQYQIGCELVHQWQQGTQLLCSPQPTDSEKPD